MFEITGAMDSPYITASGPENVNETATFTVGGSTSFTLTFNLQDDENALEDLEVLMLRLVDPGPAFPGPDARVLISDDDG